ncbi:MAG: class B sortase [Ruminococcus sp.]|nr:class B sortase [Ruminococcus sp.]MBQ7134332.1 class B sortase [Ruminococcus sp.]
MKKKSAKIIWIIVLIIAILAFLLCAGYLAWYFFFDTTKEIQEYHSTEPSVATYDETTVAVTEPPTERFLYTTEELGEQDFVNFNELMQINPDIYAWIYIPDTNVDYPVAQSGEGMNDSFYLTHNVYKNYQFSGTIYSEKQNAKDFSDPVTVLYGHNMLNGSMFATLHKFNDKTFFDNNNTMFVFTKDKIYTYLIYSAYQYDDRHILNSFNMREENSFSEYLDSTLLQRPYYCNVREGITLNTQDRILTLSTCMNGGGNVRYLVQGVLVDERDTE